MLQMKKLVTPKTGEAVFVLLLTLSLLSIFIIGLGVAPHIPLLLALFILIGYGLLKGVKYRDLEAGMVEGTSSSLGAVYLFFMIGILTSSWMVGGTIPTLMMTSFELVTPQFFFMTIFIVTGIVGISIGSSLTTVATIGVAFFSMAAALDLSLPMAAGAIVSGAFFGDKMSPLSDTTTIASKTVGVDLFEHIKNMGWTTIPAFLISAVLFAILTPSVGELNLAQLEEYKQNILATGLVHGYSWIPIIVLFICTFLRVPAVLTLFISSATALILSRFHSSYTIGEYVDILFGGFETNTGHEAIDALLSKADGLMGMMFTISLVLLALSMGGLLFKLGIIQAILEPFAHRLKTKASVIVGAACTAIGVNLAIGEQYLSILLTGQSFAPHFEKNGLAMKNLSRVMEDAGTVINPLVPWGVCGIFISTTLGIPVMSYIPFAFFCLLSPILTIIFGLTGKTLTKA